MWIPFLTANKTKPAIFRAWVFSMNTWRFYFQVTDNEDSQSLGLDMISNTQFFASPRSQSLCSVYPPDHRIWDANGSEEVHEPGYVEVTSVPE